MKNNTGPVWPIGADVVIWGYESKEHFNIEDTGIVPIARGLLLSINTITRQTIDGHEPYTAAIIVQEDGFLFSAEIEMVQVIEKPYRGPTGPETR